MSYVRESRPVKEIATMIAVHKNTVYSMIEKGELEAHRVRGVIRIYLDSVAQYQARNRVAPTAATPVRRKIRVAKHTGHLEAMDALRGAGIL